MRLLFSIVLFFSLQSNGQVINASQPYRPYIASCSYLLDQYSGAAAAYSLRQLDCQYAGSAIRVRRSSDNTEQDIGFTSGGDLDTASLKTFVGTGGTDDGFVVTWYDQSSNGNNATQSTSANQPLIMDNGVVLRINSLPSIKLDGSSDFFDLSSGLSTNTTYSVFGLQSRSLTSVNMFTFSNPGNGNGYSLVQYTDGNAYFTDDTKYVGGTDGLTGMRLFSSFRISTVLTIYRNGYSLSGLSGSISGAASYNAIGKRGGNVYANGSISELIYYNSDKSSNRTAIESNINSYYSIY